MIDGKTEEFHIKDVMPTMKKNPMKALVQNEIEA